MSRSRVGFYGLKRSIETPVTFKGVLKKKDYFVDIPIL